MSQLLRHRLGELFLRHMFRRPHLHDLLLLNPGALHLHPVARQLRQLDLLRPQRGQCLRLHRKINPPAVLQLRHRRRHLRLPPSVLMVMVSLLRLRLLHPHQARRPHLSRASSHLLNQAEMTSSRPSKERASTTCARRIPMHIQAIPFHLRSPLVAQVVWP